MKISSNLKGPCAVRGILSATVALILIGLPLPAPIEAQTPHRDDIADLLTALIQKSGLKNDQIGISLYSTQTQSVLYSLNSEKPAILASNTKLFTTTAALAKLGPEFKFSTRLLYQGERGENGLLNGDLVVIGDGDPNISGRFFEDNPLAAFTLWAQKIKELGITRISGDLLLDDHIFDSEWIHPAWDMEDLGQWWAAPTGALSFNDNCLELTLHGQKKSGAPARISLSPDTRYVTLVNRTSTVKGTPKKPIHFKWEEGNRLVMSGETKINSSSTLYVAVNHPTLFFGTVLKETLGKNGIDLKGSIKISPAIDPKPLTPIAQFESDLVRTVQIANRNSQNFYAESLLKRVGYHAKQHGSTAAGTQAVQEWLTEIGIGPVELVDGSGLARGNKAAPEKVVALLNWAMSQPFADQFVNSLAVSGDKEGTLRKRFKDADLAGKIRAKTGYLFGVKTLSGFLDTPKRDRIIFSILVNDISGNASGKVNQLQEDILRVLIQQ